MEIIVSRLLKLINDEPGQCLAFISLSVFVVMFTLKASAGNSSAFQSYFGRIPPITALGLIFIISLILFSLLLLDGKFAFYRIGNLRGILIAVSAALPFAAAMVLFDWRVPYGSDINVPLPGAFFFYPVMGYVVEILFHVLPFSLLYYGMRRFWSGADQGRIIWISILIVALLEPLFQVAFTSTQSSWLVPGFLGLHLYVFNIVQLWLFSRYDFLTMYSFRLSYYLIWHIVWGHLRLNILF